MQSSPGIYLDPMGSLKLINGHLSIVIPVNVSFISPHLYNIKAVLSTARNFCNQNRIFESSECENILQPLEVRFSDMLRDFDSVSHLVARRTKRSAWFGGVGSVFKTLFGTVDENDAIRYDNAIRVLQDDQKDLAENIKQGIVVTTFALDALNKSINQLIDNEKSLNNAVTILSDNLKNLSQGSATLNTKMKMMKIVNILENSILTLSFKLEDISNGLMFSKNNVLYPAIYSPKEFYNDLVNNLRFLPNSKELPIPLDISNVHNLIDVSSISSYYLNGKLVFVLKLPLVYPLEFNLYHVLPLPTPINNNSYAMIIPNTVYIGFSKDRTKYCHFESFDKCKSIGQNYICDHIYTLSSATHPTCESEIITKHLTKLPDECQIKAITGNIEMWQKLQENKWIFVMSKNSKFTLDCLDEHIYETNIFGTGIIEIPMGCTGYCRGIELLSKETIQINVTHIKIDFDIISNLNLSESKFSNVMPKVNIKYPNFDPLLNYNENFDLLNHKLENIINKPQLVKNYEHYYVPTTMYCILLILLALSYKYYKFCKSRSSGILQSPSIHLAPDNPEPEIELTSPTSPTPRLRF